MRIIKFSCGPNQSRVAGIKLHFAVNINPVNANSIIARLKFQFAQEFAALVVKVHRGGLHPSLGVKIV